MSNSAAFVSHDGADANGVRAEVWVQTGVGKIIEIDDSRGDVAQVAVMSNHPAVKRPTKGWLRTDDPLYAQVQEAKAADREVEYRVESQRKAKVDRTIPIKELRKTTEEARENTTLIFAGLNGTLSREAVTHPSEDAAPGGRIPAQPAAPAAPPAVERATIRPGAGEEPPYRTHNSDGVPNLGSGIVAAAVGAETFARRHLMERVENFVPDGDQEEVLVEKIAAGILHIADAVQVRVYARLGRHRVGADRNAGSHTRARNLIFDTIENYFPLPVTNLELSDEQFATWRQDVGTLATKRFLMVARLSYPAEFAEAEARQAQSTAPEAVHASQTPAEAPQGTDSAPVAPQAPEGFLAPLGHEADGPLASEDEVGFVRDLFADAEITDTQQIVALFTHTFGVAKAVDVPGALLEQFLDHYTAEGPEALRAAAQYALELRKNSGR